MNGLEKARKLLRLAIILNIIACVMNIIAVIIRVAGKG